MSPFSRTFQKTATLYRLLGDPTRLKILRTLFSAEEELCVQEIAEAINMSHSATSHQLSKLEQLGVVASFRDGQTVCYEIQENDTTRRIRKALALFD